MIESKNRLPLAFYFVEGVKVPEKEMEEWHEKFDLKSEFHDTNIMHSRPFYRPNILH